MKLFSLFIKIKGNAPSYALKSEVNPLQKYSLDTENNRSAFNKQIEVTAKAVLQRCHFIKLQHKFIRINTTFKVNRYFQT